MKKWTIADIPSQRGKRAVVTGANSGLGFEVARELARAGAEVVLACRNLRKGEAAAARLRAEIPRVRVSLAPLDLADLKSVRKFTAGIARRGALDLLANNAGLMGLPRREETADGFEMQFGVNHLGHFALTARLLPALLRAKSPRVVTVSSLAHTWATMDFGDLQAQRFYSPWVAYAQSKLANLLFALELHRRAAHLGLVSVAAHPGLSATNLIPTGAPGGVSLTTMVLTVGNSVFTQSAAHGALPILYAATAAKVSSGEYYGPDGFGEFWGWPRRARIALHAQDAEDARRLWQISERLTGVDYDKIMRRIRPQAMRASAR